MNDLHMSSGYLTRVLKIVFQHLRCGRNKKLFTNISTRRDSTEGFILKVVKINGFKNGHY